MTIGLVSADPEVPTQDTVVQYIGQGADPGLTETEYDASFGETYLTGTAAHFASQGAGMHPTHDPDPQIAAEVHTILTNEEVTTPPDVVGQVVHDEIMEALDVPLVVQPHSDLPENSQDMSDGCSLSVFGLCLVFD